MPPRCFQNRVHSVGGGGELRPSPWFSRGCSSAPTYLVYVQTLLLPASFFSVGTKLAGISSHIGWFYPRCVSLTLASTPLWPGPTCPEPAWEWKDGMSESVSLLTGTSL